MPETTPLDRLTQAGVSIWLDDMNRVRLATGTLESLVHERHVTGMTSNPTIFHKAISGSDVYDEQLRDLARRRVHVGEALRAITTYDVRWACDVLRPVYDATGHTDGRVSIEVDPRIAHDTDAQIAEARALWWLVDRPNMFVKIPATREGLPAISRCLAEGISINVTLIFALDRYDAVMTAFLDGIEAAHAAGHDVTGIRSVASFFVSRVDTEVDERLDKLGTGEAQVMRGKAALANARIAYEHYERMLSGGRWQALAAAGAQPQRPLWASTSTKDPAYDDTMYVADLVAPGVVNTMPEGTLEAVLDHGVIEPDTIRGSYGQAHATLDRLQSLGVDYGDVVQTLEDEGIEKFTASWTELEREVDTQLRAAARRYPSTQLRGASP
jgi:transaldolase